MRDAKQTAAEVLKMGGPKNTSTFYGFYVLQALAKAGDTDTALDFISRYWGAMLDLGATTFWEDFDLALDGKRRRASTNSSPRGRRTSTGGYGRLLLCRLSAQPLPRLGERPHRVAQ